MNKPPIRIVFWMGWAALVYGVAIGGVAAAVEPTPLDRVAPYRRFLYVTRWNYRTAEDVRRVIRNAAAARFSDVLFQVRGEATVFYPSRHEPWAWELTGSTPETTGRDPGWDPLSVALVEAARYDLRVHAYLNVLPAWKQATEPPSAAGHLLTARRDWLMRDRHGRTMRPEDWYTFLDPALPEVRRHLAQVFGEVAATYPALSGVHLDYIRYPHEKGDYSYHPRVVRAFRNAHGAAAPRERPKEWAQFRRDQVTATVRAISEAVREAARRNGRTIELSAAVMADLDKTRNHAFQSPLQWLDDGLLDAIAPMAYYGDVDLHTQQCRTFAKHKDRVWMALTGAPKSAQLLTPKIRRTEQLGFGGVAVFAYPYLFPEHRSTPLATDVYREFARARTVAP